jgi:hypothetical protein
MELFLFILGELAFFTYAASRSLVTSLFDSRNEGLNGLCIWMDHLHDIYEKARKDREKIREKIPPKHRQTVDEITRRADEEYYKIHPEKRPKDLPPPTEEEKPPTEQEIKDLQEAIALTTLPLIIGNKVNSVNQKVF